MRKLALHWQILIAIVLAVIAGSWVRSFTTDDFMPNIFGVPFVAIFDYVGKLFLNALKMIIVPLITSSIIVGVAFIGSGGKLGKLGLLPHPEFVKVLGYRQTQWNFLR